ncbi:hypothetical protein NE237_014824 [Protea cynaroides]|uniref:Uncharacterized protein n=1 Tax=Protea cynaroides TaxID=273540 RepID=A0A9Q0KCQ9_9MAGN|nr:hypothetical protein NE237_014824 [Protea cynaroides]
MNKKFRPPVPGAGVIGGGRGYGRGAGSDVHPNAVLLWDRDVFLQPVDAGSRDFKRHVVPPAVNQTTLRQSSISMPSEGGFMGRDSRSLVGTSGGGSSRSDWRMRFHELQSHAGRTGRSKSHDVFWYSVTGVRTQPAQMFLGGMMPLPSARNLQEQIRVPLSHVTPSLVTEVPFNTVEGMSIPSTISGRPAVTVPSGAGGGGPAVAESGTANGSINGNYGVDLGKFLGFPSLEEPVPFLGNVGDSLQSQDKENMEEGGGPGGLDNIPGVRPDGGIVRLDGNRGTRGDATGTRGSHFGQHIQSVGGSQSGHGRWADVEDGDSDGDVEEEENIEPYAIAIVPMDVSGLDPAV